ncbi:rna exonuclease [Coemansia aciculifera]|uniref:Rna exonuclease n=1 Tax=Coemansia aciculifera TaxID=417176 RepID=A0ACC1M711_9FUNG|nr:rna exonuclease [Coemansia aciculifera]
MGQKQSLLRSVALRQKKAVTRKLPPLVWIDIEMTGLVAEKDIILEVAMIVTDGELNELAPAQSLVIGHSRDKVRSKLNAWSLNCHTKSGLLEEVWRSKLTLAEAEKMLLDRILEHCPKANRALLAGNNVGFDRRFIEQHMPVLAGHLHFRNVDVSSVNELAKRWMAPEKLAMLKKTLTHRAIDDISQSLEELRFYKRYFFVPR